MATNIPPELLQSILLLLDFDSFHCASRTCRTWRNAAQSAHLLRHKLQTVPGLDLSLHTTQQDLKRIYQHVCRRNLIGIRNGVQFSTPESSICSSGKIGSIPVRSRHGVQSAHVRGMTLVLDPSASAGLAGKGREVQLSPSIFPSADAMKRVMEYSTHGRAFFSARSFARLQVALSDCGNLVAVGLGQKLHVYLLTQMGKQRQNQVQHVEVNVSDSILDSIQSVEFAEGDEVLRCEVDSVEGSYVRYLGFRKCSCTGLKASLSAALKFKFWKVALRHVYLDSRDVEDSLGDGMSLRGMRLVKSPRRPGECTCRAGKYFFAMFRPGTCENKYAVARISSGGVDVIQRIPARRMQFTSYLETRTPLQGHSSDADRWDLENLPLAHCHDPILNVSDDGKILAVFEPPYGQAHGVIYLCSGDSMYWGDVKTASQAWPVPLCSLDHDLDSLHVSLDGTGYVVGAGSQRHTMQWRLQV
ncbi:hypothetical protein ASPVEDRAFT_46385 [Aspergillus versicolor CBS 583.65]|uniref:F-box domain-containing protein n=1 Tax=Aspergillus versicolor CBS 583.65 TaxID=1036611 RepID=A0A1L9PZP2_ASPVE|nr:uncharacterized protein ASPVEDRAFT_46385 [Aspergillus versicolor CBS 583.65]OJJ07000.1 hypothetical protein ASPVEDRAFT_46385 [Aspergillus versicolor CBS 583.65]